MADETKPKKADTIKVRILRDFWGEENTDGSENRCRAGEVLEMPTEAAFEAVEQGMAERVKG